MIAVFEWIGGYQGWVRQIGKNPYANAYVGLFYLRQDELKAATMLEF